MLLVYGFPADGVVTPAYFYMVLATTVATSFTRYDIFHCSRHVHGFLRSVQLLTAQISSPLSYSDSTVAFVSMGAFMTVIADPVIGGTYMTVRGCYPCYSGSFFHINSSWTH